MSMAVSRRPPSGSNPVDIETDAVSETGRYMLFSGGYDSLVATYKCLEEVYDGPDTVLHIDTNTGIPENREFVERVCYHFGWDLRVQEAPVTLLEFAKKYHFPGAGAHQWVYAYLKERALREVSHLYDFKPEYYTGVRQAESERRMENVTADTEETERWVWHAPIRDFEDEDVEEFIEDHHLPKNPVVEHIHRSGECNCGAFANRDEELIMFEANYPGFYEWLMEVEAEVQAYHGRLKLFEDRWPRAYDRMEETRKTVSPRPDRLELLGWLYPARHEGIHAVDREVAITRGQKNPRNWWGHHHTPDKSLQALIHKEDPKQMTLCAGCFKRHPDEPQS